MTPDQQLQELFHSFRSSSWRWECQREYAVDAVSLQQWRDGVPDDPERKRPWLDYIRDITGRDIRFERVRMLADPPTEYQRFLLDRTSTNVAAGEDIRWISEATARELGELPATDFYLLDDERVATMRFDDDHLLAGVDVTDDPATVTWHRAWRDTVWPHAVRHTDYFASRSP